MNRISRDELGLLLATAWSMRGTCTRRKVGCVLVDADGYVLSSGYNGPAKDEPHCIDVPCPGAKAPPGTGLDLCQAIHAEMNAIALCPDLRRIRTAYVTASPCLHPCVKMLMNTSCRRIVFLERYAHDEPAERMWVASGQKWFPDGRTWEHKQMDFTKILANQGGRR